MALLQYLQHTDGLLAPKGTLSSAIPAQAIAWVNQELQMAMEKDILVRQRRKRDVFTIATAPEMVLTEKYASQHGVDVAIHMKAAHRDPIHSLPFSQCM